MELTGYQMRSPADDDAAGTEERSDRDGDESVPDYDVISPNCQDVVPAEVRFRLYTSHIFSTFNSRVFEFGAVLYLASTFPSTLLPMSIYAVSRSALTVVFGPAIGRWIDQGERLKVVRASIVGGRLAVALSCILFWILERSIFEKTWEKQTVLGVLIVFACIEKICGTMNLVAVEKDWAVVIAGSNEIVLRDINASIRRIDLMCKLCGPLAIALLDGYSTQVAILMNLGSNVLSIPIEYFAIAQVYSLVRGLQTRKQSNDRGLPNAVSSLPRRAEISGRHTCSENLVKVTQQIRTSAGLYFTHRAFLPSFSLALLYFTVLSFSGQMVTYLASVGYHSFQIGLARTVAVIFEVSATWLSPFVMAKIGPIRSGIWFINWQILCLGCGIGAFWSFPDSSVASFGLVASTILSRVGLWGFDLAVQVIVQEEVEPELRGAFSSMEASWQNAFELCSYAVTMMLSRPEEFGAPVLTSGVAAFTAGVLYTWFVRRRRGHLVHLSDCVKQSKGRRELPYQAMPLMHVSEALQEGFDDE